MTYYPDFIHIERRNMDFIFRGERYHVVIDEDDIRVFWDEDLEDMTSRFQILDTSVEYWVGLLLAMYEGTEANPWTEDDYHRAAQACMLLGVDPGYARLEKLCGISTQWAEAPYTYAQMKRNVDLYLQTKGKTTFGYMEGSD